MLHKYSPVFAATATMNSKTNSDQIRLGQRPQRKTPNQHPRARQRVHHLTHLSFACKAPRPIADNNGGPVGTAARKPANGRPTYTRTMFRNGRQDSQRRQPLECGGTQIRHPDGRLTPPWASCVESGSHQMEARQQNNYTKSTTKPQTKRTPSGAPGLGLQSDIAGGGKS